MARLPQGVRKRKDGKLEKRFTFTENGKRYSVYGASTKELIEKEQELREKLKQGCYVENRNITLNQYFERWIENKEKHTKANTIRSYSVIYNTRLRNEIGNCKIKDIERRQITELQNRLALELNPTSTNYVITVLKGILNDAVNDEIIVKNPASKIKPIKNENKATETYHRALTKEEQYNFMQVIRDDYYYSFIALMITTGMRSGEVGALTWQDIDFKNKIIHVNKTITRDKKGNKIVGNSTKTGAGKRDIPINETIEEILINHRNKSELLPFNTCNVFVTQDGYIVGVQSINYAINRALKKLEDAGKHIEPFTSHALRDTFATRFIEQGGNMQTLKNILGHSSITMTMDLYAHVLADTKQEEMNKIRICV